MMRQVAPLSILLSAVVACGDDPSAASADAGVGADAGGHDLGDAGIDPPLACEVEGLPYAVELVRFTPGERAGFGQDGLPEIVLGPPGGGVEGAGSLDVLSLGERGEIVLRVDPPIVDGPGVDFVIWENPFYIGGDPTLPFAEFAEVAVSEDGEVWWVYACDPESPSAPGEWIGCAGWSPRVRFDACEMQPIDPSQTGGDPFDLADIGLPVVNFVRITDLGTNGDEGTAGFDLDALGVVRHPQP